jgi:uncharacterized protein (UPF0335 family)
MKEKEINQFNALIMKALRITHELKEVGTDIDKIIAIANKEGYDFNAKDLEEIQAKAKESGSSDDQERALVGAAVLAGGVIGPPVVVSAAVAV